MKKVVAAVNSGMSLLKAAVEFFTRSCCRKAFQESWLEYRYTFFSHGLFICYNDFEHGSHVFVELCNFLTLDVHCKFIHTVLYKTYLNKPAAGSCRFVKHV